MSLRTRSWEKVIALAKAKAGGGTTDGDNDALQLFINAAVRTLIDYSPYWTRLLCLQQRSVINGVVPMSEDSYEVKGAGTESVNGLYVRNGSIANGGKYTLFDQDGTTELSNLAPFSFNPGPGPGAGDITSWAITYIDGSSFGVYVNNTAQNTPPATGWEVGSGDAESPAPTTEALKDIDEVIEVWSGPKWREGGTSNQDYRGSTGVTKEGWYLDASGIRLTRPETDTVFVGFKRDFNEEFGDGTGGTVSDIPYEWADYIAYHAARSLQDTQRSAGDFAGIALRQIDEIRDSQLLLLNRANAMQVLKNYFNTYYNYDCSIR